jgi:outer membrane protein OmpA-like peptidoglycan-associated protein
LRVSRKLFVSFAESDGGHSYLAARAMLKPSHIAHLVFRTSVADSLDAVASGQANFTIVPAYNSITQWEGATLKALATGQFEIFAQVCMPTSYVLVAHRDYMLEFVNAYINLREPQLDPTAEEAAKIYTRFLTRIFVGAQADEQYRGRLVRPDISHASVELSRNPLRILEEMSRTELFKAMAAQAPTRGNFGPLPTGVSGGTINIGATPVLAQQPITVGAPQGGATGTVSLMELQAPAALVAAGLLEAPGDPTGWEQDGSLGEIISVLRKLLVLLNVNAFGAPDLPDNKTQYLLIGRKGATLPADALGTSDGIPDDAPTRIMTLVKPSSKMSSADRWMKPRNLLTKRARDHGYVFDRPPLTISSGNVPVYLFEGGKPKSGVSPNPVGMAENIVNWMGRTFAPGDDKAEKAKAAKSLRTALEKKQERKTKDGSAEKFDIAFLGQYRTWCAYSHDEKPTGTCSCSEDAHIDKELEETGVGIGPLIQFLLAGLVALTALALVVTPIYCGLTGACNWFGPREQTFEPRVEAPISTPSPATTDVAPNQIAPSTPASTSPTSTPTSTYPGLAKTPPAVIATPQTTAETKPPVVIPPAPKADVPKPPPVFHVAFFEAKANLTPEAMNALASAATQFLQMNRNTNVRLVSLGPRERDDTLWQRRLYAVKDELVRLGVPAGRIRYEGSGPYLVMIRATQPTRPAGSSRRRTSQYLDSVPDPMSGEF